MAEVVGRSPAMPAPEETGARLRPPRPDGVSFVLLDGSGVMLSAEGQDVSRGPASLTKMATLYLMFELLHAGELALSDAIRVSPPAARVRGHKLGLTLGQTITVHEAIAGLTVYSGNDVAVAVAEHIAGDQQRFVDAMNRKGAALGLSSTRFTTPHGLAEPGQVTTARDMAMLGWRLYHDFPGYRPWLALTSFLFFGRRLPARNLLLTTYPGMSGIKTGTTPTDGHHLVGAAVRDGRHLVTCVMGCSGQEDRDARTAALLDTGFNLR